MPPAAIIGGTSLAGGIAGAIGSTQSQTTSVNLADPTALQQQLNTGVGQDYTKLQDLVNAGPGQQDVTNSYNNSQSLAAILGQYAQSGGMPSSSDFTQANGLASSAFAGQNTALQQSFASQLQGANNSAALMGRDGNDPSLQGALRSSQMLQSQQLSANQGSYANQLAMQLPGQRLGFAQQQNQLLGGLATQALQNRQSLLSMGNNMLGQQQQYQMQRSGQTTSQHQGGGFGGFLTGAMGGAGAGMSVASMGQMGGGGAGGAGGGMGGGGGQGFGASSYGASGMSQGATGGGYSLFSGAGGGGSAASLMGA